VNARILVTGASGFVGPYLVRRLQAEGYRVTALHRRSLAGFGSAGVEHVQCDLTDSGSAETVIRRQDWDAIVHLAGTVPKRWTRLPGDYQVLSNHARIALHLMLGIPPDWNGRLVFLSTLGVYGLPAALPVREEDPLAPMNIYGAAKAAAEEIFLAIARQRRQQLWILRAPGIFSEERRDGGVYHMCLAALRGEPVILRAAIPTPWDLLHVADVVEAIIRCLHAEPAGAGIVNISYGERVGLSLVAARIVRLAATGADIRNAAPFDHPEIEVSVAKAARLFAWPPCSLDTRLASILASLRSGMRNGIAGTADRQS